MRRFTSAEATAYGFLTVTLVFCLLPFLWVLQASMDPNASLFLSLPKGIIHASSSSSLIDRLPTPAATFV